MGDATPVTQMAVAIVGGMITGGTHFAKSGSRAAINTSPEPFSNWTASFGEDGVVLGGLFSRDPAPGAIPRRVGAVPGSSRLGCCRS